MSVYVVKSFVELTRYLLSVPGVEVTLSRQISQDPLEQFFGCQQQQGGFHDVKSFCKTPRWVLQVVNLVRNCCGYVTDDIDLGSENQPFPRRKKMKSAP